MGHKKIEHEGFGNPANARVFSRKNVQRYSERAAQRNRKRFIKKSVGFTVLGVLCAALIGVGGWFLHIASQMRNPALITQSLLATLVDTDITKDPFYMLLLGTDGRPGETSFRSDTIILAHVIPQTKQVTLVSIPRDTRVTVNGETMKINATHAYGGPEAVVLAVNDLCGVEISHYAEISFDGMRKLVDALGGVEVNVPDRIDDPKAFVDRNAGDTVIEPGLQVLDGRDALAFCRSRAYADGDYTRMRHQRIFIAALADQILSTTDPATIAPVIESLSSMIVTDLSFSDIIALANTMRGMDTNAIYSANVPSTTDTIGGISYVIADEYALAEMMERVEAGEDPKGPQSVGSAEEGGDTTIGDITGASNGSQDSSGE